MVEAVGRHGFDGTTLAELVSLAGVSKTTFYEHFDSKQDCFLATFDEIVRIATKRIGQAYRGPGTFDERLNGSLSTFMELAVAEPEAASLVAVDSLTLGAAGVAHRERGSEIFEQILSQTFEHTPGVDSVPPLTAKMIVAGIRGVVYRRLRTGRAEELPDCVEELVAWVLGYQAPDGEATKQAMQEAALPRPAQASIEAKDAKLSWQEPPASRRSRATLTQRERIARGATRVVVERGYQALSIPAISAEAGTSNQTFYENFSDKREVFLEAFELLAHDAVRGTAAAFEAESDWPKAVGAGMRALLEHIAAHEIFARVAFFELQTAGPEALDHADAAMDAFTAFLDSDSSSEQARTAPTMILEAIGSGVWASVQHLLVHGPADELPERAPELARLVVVPLVAKAGKTGNGSDGTRTRDLRRDRS
jgi:AcrR family transcriptional regulator